MFSPEKTPSLYESLKDLIAYCYCSRSKLSIMQNLNKLSSCCAQALLTQQQSRGGPSGCDMDDEYDSSSQHSQMIMFNNSHNDIRTTIQQVAVQNLMKAFPELSQMDAVELVAACTDLLMQCPLDISQIH